MIAAGQLADAAAILAGLNLAVAADNVPAVLLAATSLARLRPHDPSVTLNLAIARLKSRHLALARQAFAAFADHWHEHEQAAQARLQANELGEHLAALWAEQGLASPPDFDVMARNEEAQELLFAGDWRQATRLAEQALRARPDFAPLRNNLSLAYQMGGHLERAIAAAREVLVRDGRNLHALGNLTRFLVLAGRLDEARALAERLQALPTTNVQVAVKQAEALSFFGDDAAVLAAFDRVQRLKDRDDDPSASALLHRLAAVASLRQGRALAARRRWQKALELNPGRRVAGDDHVRG